MRAKGLKPRSAKFYLTNFALVETFGRKRGPTKQRVVSDVCSDMKGVKSEPVRTFMVEDIAALSNALEQRKARAADDATDMRAAPRQCRSRARYHPHPS